MPDERMDQEPPVEGLRRLYEDAVPAPGLEERVVGALRREGALRPTPWRRLQPFALAATIVLAFALGYALRQPATPQVATRPAESRWVMLLYAVPGENAPEERRDEYARWAAQSKDSGVVVTGGEEFASGGWALTWDRPEGHWSDTNAVAGYFVVQAPDYDHALRIARTCPHIRYGGKVELRKIIGA